MSIKKTVESTTDKILNSDIYELTAFVNDIKKENIDGVEDKETLLLGMYGYMGYQFTSLLQNSIVTASELANEAIPVRAKFDRNVITHALSLGISKVSATPANMKVLMMFPEKALQANMDENKVFIFRADTPLNFDEYEFHTDYDIRIVYNVMHDSNNGVTRDYVYTANYMMDEKNPISDIENQFLPPLTIFKFLDDDYVVLATNLHQVFYKCIEEKIIGNDEIANKTISFEFDNQLSHFFVRVIEADGNEVYLTPVYDGLYTQGSTENIVYYQYINTNTIRLRFDPSIYQPSTNADIYIDVYTTYGEKGNFEYTEEKEINLTSDRYTNLFVNIAQRGDDGSSGGIDRLSTAELQHIIPKEALSRGSITTLTDLRNYFNSLNNETSVLHVFRKEDNILDRVYYVYDLIKDEDFNIVPTNSIPIYLEAKHADPRDGKIYLESGTQLFYYKYGDGASVDVLKDNWVGYLQQQIVDTGNIYKFYNTDYNMFQGQLTEESARALYNYQIETYGSNTFNDLFDPESVLDLNYNVKPPSHSFDFHSNSTLYFKSLVPLQEYLDSNPSDIPNNASAYDNFFYGTCLGCCYKDITHSTSSTIIPWTRLIANTIQYQLENGEATDLEMEIQYVNEQGVILTTHYPARANEQQPIEYDSDGNIIDGIKDSTGTYLFAKDNPDLSHNWEIYTKAIRFYRPAVFDKDNNITGYYDYCQFELPVDFSTITDDDGIAREHLVSVHWYTWCIEMYVYDSEGTFKRPFDNSDLYYTSYFYVPGYYEDLSMLDENNRKLYGQIKQYYLNSGPGDDTCFNKLLNNRPVLTLESIYQIPCYSYSSQGEWSFDNMKLTEGDIIRFNVFSDYKDSDDTIAEYTDPSTWKLGEILAIEYYGGRIIAIEVLTKGYTDSTYESIRYVIPTVGDELNTECITNIFVITKFMYTTPFSIILKDNPLTDSHRVTASYYLDIIDETRYLNFDCVNSCSPLQFIMSSVHTYRSSYLSENRYKYKITMDLVPNLKSTDNDMPYRTQVICAFYENDRPVMYNIADYEGMVDNAMRFTTTLYSKPFSANSYDDTTETTKPAIIDDYNRVYIGPEYLISELNTDDLDEEEKCDIFWEQYHSYQTSSTKFRSLDNTMTSLDGIDSLDGQNGGIYVQSVYLPLNVTMKIYTLYKYNDDIVLNKYHDDLSYEYRSVNSRNADALFNFISKNTPFEYDSGEVDPDTKEPIMVKYTLGNMVLTNVYSTYDGLNLLYDYSNIMNSYVSLARGNDLFDANNTSESEFYIVNRVPCIRYFYWWNEDRVLSLLKEIKRKINYVLDAISPLECTFGLDFKLFNTYGPARMYYLTDDDGNVSDLIDNVALTMTFRTAFYNEKSDSDSIIPMIKNSIKEYIEQLDDLSDIHFPNITTLIETDYSEYIRYFEFVSFNIYDANYQHIITDEDMEMLKQVPEFLHVDTSDYTGLPLINIRIMVN